MPPYVTTLISLTGVGAAIFGLWWNVRRTQLRRDDVLAWANEVITALAGLELLCALREPQIEPAERRALLTRIIFDTSILADRGRMFFRNVERESYGLHKPPAYRGFRPRILDPIVTAHKIACALDAADPETRLRMRALSEDCLQHFVSLAQSEVGRSRNVSLKAGRGSERSDLAMLLESIQEQRIEGFRKSGPS